MLYTTAFAASLATVAYAVQFDLDMNNPIVMTEGEPLTLNWSGADGAVTINLVTGASTDLETVFAITTDRTTDSFTWTPEGIPSGTYAFEIEDASGDINWTPQYTYQSTGVPATSSADEETSTAAATSTATSDDEEETSTAAVTATAEPTETEEPTTMVTMTGVSNSTSATSGSASATGSDEPSATADEANSETTDIVNANSGARFGTSLSAAMGVAAVFAFLN